MVRTRALRFLLILGLVALLIPVSLAHADGHDGSGKAFVRDAVLLGDPFAGDIPEIVPHGRLVVSMTDIEDPGEDMALEGWLISDDGDSKLSVGIFEVSGNGEIDHEFVVADSEENLIEGYDTFVITIEPNPDDDPMPTENVLHETAVPGKVMEQVRLLLDTNGPSATVNLVKLIDMAYNSAEEAKDALEDGDLGAMGTHLDSLAAIVKGVADSEDEPGLAAYVEQVVEAATAAGDAAPAHDDVTMAKSAIISAANKVKSGAESATAAGVLAKESTSTQVATLHIGNVMAHMKDAKDQAEMVYTGTQDLATYRIPMPPIGPSVGEPLIPQMVRYGIIGSIVLVLAGSVLFLGSRRRSGASAA